MNDKQPVSGQNAGHGRKRPWLFFLLAYGWSWLMWSPAILFGWEWGEPRTMIVFVSGVGPLVAALVLLYRGYTDEPASSFWRRVFDVRRIGVVWWVPIIALPFGVNLIARLFSSGAAAGDTDPVTIGGLLVIVLIFGMGAGFVEEIGWRGYALDPIQQRHSALVASLIIGIAWSAWHLPLFFIEGSYHHGLGVGTIAFWLFVLAIVFWSVLYTWVYNHTARSILAVILMHAFYNIAAEVAGPAGDQEYVRIAILGAITVVVVILWGPRTLARLTIAPGRSAV